MNKSLPEIFATKSSLLLDVFYQTFYDLHYDISAKIATVTQTIPVDIESKYYIYIQEDLFIFIKKAFIGIVSEIFFMKINFRFDC